MSTPNLIQDPTLRRALDAAEASGVQALAVIQALEDLARIDVPKADLEDLAAAAGALHLRTLNELHYVRQLLGGAA